MNFVVLSSSRGTTFQAVIDAMRNGTLTAECLGLISDNKDRGCVEKARAAGISVKIVSKNQEEEREDYDKRLHATIIELGGVPEDTIIAALGWMYILSPWFVKMWHRRILNVHPSLLPKFPGAHAIDDAIAAKETESGMTIHVIDEGVDTGPIIEQKKCSILSSDTREDLRIKIQELEKEWYPKVLQKINSGEMKLPV